MKKILTTMIIVAAISISPLFLSGADKTPIDFGKINKAIALFQEAHSFETEGKTVKAKRKTDEGFKILNILFSHDKIITADKKCYFVKVKNYDNRKRIMLSCSDGNIDTKVKVYFEFMGKDDGNDWGDFSNFMKKDGFTSNSIIEKYEDDFMEFTGKIQLYKAYVGETYKFDTFGSKSDIIIKCKVLAVKPITVVE